MDNEITITTKQIKQAIDNLVDERDSLQDKVYHLQDRVNQLEISKNNAIDFIDQVLQYHLSPFDYKQVDEDINMLIGILRGGSNE